MSHQSVTPVASIGASAAEFDENTSAQMNSNTDDKCETAHESAKAKAKANVGTASLADLKDAVKDSLVSRGVFQKIKARMRAEVFKTLEDKDIPTPRADDDTLFLNEIVREYLHFHGYRHALDVFVAEAGIPEDSNDRLDRDFMAEHMRMRETEHSTRLPLLYAMLSEMRTVRNRGTQQRISSPIKLRSPIPDEQRGPGSSDIPSGRIDTFTSEARKIEIRHSKKSTDEFGYVRSPVHAVHTTFGGLSKLSPGTEDDSMDNSKQSLMSGVDTSGFADDLARNVALQSTKSVSSTTAPVTLPQPSAISF